MGSRKNDTFFAKKSSKSSKYFIDEYGAKADTFCTDAIQKAIDECFLNGGGEVVVPTGVWRTGSVRLRSNVTLHLMENAILEGSKNPEDYTGYIRDEIEPIDPSYITEPTPTADKPAGKSRSVCPCSRWNNAIIRAIHAENISIIGEKGSVIDGKNCYDPEGEEDYRGPHAINFWYCKNITFKGYTIKDSANWAHAIQNSQNITASEITVLAGHDGFDVRTCDNVLIEDCRFFCGDDSIAGFDNIDVTIRNCVLNSSCSLIRFGGTNVLIESCTGIGPGKYAHRYTLSDEKKCLGADCDESCRNNTLTVFLYYCDYRAKVRRVPGNIIVRNCDFSNIDCVFKHDFGEIWCKNRPLDNIQFENCRFEDVCQPIYIQAPENEPVSIAMKNCYVSARKDKKDIKFAELKNCKEFIMDNVETENFADFQNIPQLNKKQ